jgi:hypothetical protein
MKIVSIEFNNKYPYPSNKKQSQMLYVDTKGLVYISDKKQLSLNKKIIIELGEALEKGYPFIIRQIKNQN